MKEEHFWSIDEKRQTSWTWKSILNIRHLASNFLRCRLGDGNSLSFWFDSWTPLGPLVHQFGPNGTRELGISINSTVASTCNRNGWKLRPSRSIQSENLTSINLPSLSTVEDSFYWHVNGKELLNFSTKETWNSIRLRSSYKQWT